jgi:hypothetical protein
MPAITKPDYFDFKQDIIIMLKFTGINMTCRRGGCQERAAP